MQGAALTSADVQDSFAHPNDASDIITHSQRLLNVRHPHHQRAIDQLLAGDADGTKYGFVGWAVNLVYLPQVRDCVRVSE